MKLHIHVHHYDTETSRILKLITLKLENMPTKQEFDALRNQFVDALENIADDIKRLAGQLEQGGLSAEEEATVLAEFQALADRAKAIADETPDETTTTTTVA